MGGGGGAHNMEKGAWQHVFALLISINKCRKSHSSYLVLVNWKLPYVVFGVYYILIPICPCFLLLFFCLFVSFFLSFGFFFFFFFLVYCVAACM